MQHVPHPVSRQVGAFGRGVTRIPVVEIGVFVYIQYKSIFLLFCGIQPERGGRAGKPAFPVPAQVLQPDDPLPFGVLYRLGGGERLQRSRLQRPFGDTKAVCAAGEIGGQQRRHRLRQRKAAGLQRNAAGGKGGWLAGCGAAGKQEQQGKHSGDGFFRHGQNLPFGFG